MYGRSAMVRYFRGHINSSPHGLKRVSKTSLTLVVNISLLQRFPTLCNELLTELRPLLPGFRCPRGRLMTLPLLGGQHRAGTR